ncbi:hypothetical protein L1285_10845 [Pseudoalteromonas sp. DL2-H2.2]|nr:hypothetical protein [Pseudoalteromonas sp. DL2-H2.2]MCF2908816.1 hypothetical protein [Pseudoalteromonas sp. DL2-H2.2]
MKLQVKKKTLKKMSLVNSELDMKETIKVAGAAASATHTVYSVGTNCVTN